MKGLRNVWIIHLIRWWNRVFPFVFVIVWLMIVTRVVLYLLVWCHWTDSVIDEWMHLLLSLRSDCDVYMNDNSMRCFNAFVSDSRQEGTAQWWWLLVWTTVVFRFSIHVWEWYESDLLMIISFYNTRSFLLLSHLFEHVDDVIIASILKWMWVWRLLEQVVQWTLPLLQQRMSVIWIHIICTLKDYEKEYRKIKTNISINPVISSNTSSFPLFHYFYYIEYHHEWYLV